MKKTTIVLLIIAASLILAGVVLGIVGMTLSAGGFSWGDAMISFGKRDMVTKEYEISEKLSEIDAVLTTTDVEILPAADGVLTSAQVAAKVQDNSLNIAAADAVKAAITPEIQAAHPEFMQGESVAPGMQLIVTYTQGTSSMQDVAEVRADGAADGSAIAIAKSTALAPTFMDKICFWTTPLPEGAVKEVTITRAEIGMKPNAVTGWIVTGFFVVFISFYAAGPGVCVWLALSELMPTRIRANGMAIALLINQGVSTTIAGTFLPWVGSAGYSSVFFCLAGFTVIYFITAAFFLPETKGRTLEEIEQYFTTGKMPEKN